MRIAEKRMPAAVVGVLFAALLVVVMTLGSHSAVADPDGPVPNPGHGWTSIQGHGDDADGVYVSTQSDEAFEVRVNGSRALRLEPDAICPNVIGGHSNNSVTGGAYGATIGGGGDATYTNRVTDSGGTIGGGVANLAGDQAGDTDDAVFGTVGGGFGNQASANAATVGGGTLNEASGPGGSTVGGGGGNTASDTYATVGGGYSNNASGDYATIPGGYDNTAAGSYSFAAGRQAKADNAGCFVWADSTAADYTCSTDNRFMTRANGGARFDVNNGEWVEIRDDATNLINTSTGAYLTLAGVWGNASDVALKDNFTPVDGQEVVSALAEMPITTWNSKAEDPSITHMGPTAQDFYDAFGLGPSDTSIGTLDADGVALAAIQGLYELSQEQDARIDTLEARVAALETGAPVVRVAPAEAGSESLASSIMPGGWLLLAGLFVLGGLVVAQLRLRGVGR